MLFYSIQFAELYSWFQFLLSRNQLSMLVWTAGIWTLFTDAITSTSNLQTNIVPQSLRCFCLHPRTTCPASKRRPGFTLKAYLLVIVTFLAIFNTGVRATATSLLALLVLFGSESIAFNHFLEFFEFIAPRAFVAHTLIFIRHTEEITFSKLPIVLPTISEADAPSRFSVGYLQFKVFSPARSSLPVPFSMNPKVDVSSWFTPSSPTLSEPVVFTFCVPSQD